MCPHSVSVCVCVCADGGIPFNWNSLESRDCCRGNGQNGNFPGNRRARRDAGKSGTHHLSAKVPGSGESEEAELNGKMIFQKKLLSVVAESRQRRR